MGFRNPKPVYLYVAGAACFILSRIFEESGIALLDYLFILLGLILIVLATMKYFKKTN